MSNAYVSYPFTRPVLSVQQVPGGGQFGRSYSETLYEVVSQQELDDDDLKHLDAVGVLGFGQAYSVEKRETFTEDAPPVEVDRRTGAPTGNPPMHYGELITKAHPYTYHRIVVRRICDSGD